MSPYRIVCQRARELSAPAGQGRGPVLSRFLDAPQIIIGHACQLAERYELQASVALMLEWCESSASQFKARASRDSYSHLLRFHRGIE